MIVDANEILFILKNAPHGMLKTLATNIGVDYSKVRATMYSLREDYPDDMVKEARRLLETNTGLTWEAQVKEAQA